MVSNSILFKPVLIISTIGGVCTLKCTNSIHFSILATTFTTILLIINLIHCCLIPKGIFNLVEDNEKTVNSTITLSKIDQNDPDFVVKMINSFSVSLTSLICRILCLKYMKTYLPRQLFTIDIADVLLEPKNKKLILRNINLMSIGIFFLCFPMQLVSNFVLSKRKFSVAVMFFINTWNNFSVTCIELQFIISCYLLFKRFQLINNKLEALNKLTENCSSLFIINDSSNKLSKKQSIYQEITKLYKSYKHLCIALHDINNSYSVQLFLSIAYCNLNVLINIYFAIFGGYFKPEDKSKSPQTVIDIFNNFFWGSYYFLRFFLVALFSHLCLNESKYSTVKVLDIQSRFLDRNTKDELQLMLQYTANRKSTFSALGFFKINLKLVTSAVATGMTYLVIMVQFNNDKKSKIK